MIQVVQEDLYATIHGFEMNEEIVTSKQVLVDLVFCPTVKDLAEANLFEMQAAAWSGEVSRVLCASIEVAKMIAEDAGVDLLSYNCKMMYRGERV